ncbi:hypothetical protein FN846DRAFT_885858 [Sphaerosporella brunnea]|uniref:Uncharacterized protein n=1 Tax=Sphaerosporella brunnea TaxID=1250544 RepID=A0A5J5FAP1_9PEZI|nr:hypothetical protein FN846DRAFT_885858 [Sphaerosporella brunnea]
MSTPLSTIGIFLILGALISLWDFNLKSSPTSLRSTIARGNKTPTVITASSVILRICVALQLGICGMMLATLAFYEGSILLKDAAAVSMLRHAGSTPWSMALPIFQGALVSKKFGPLFLVLLLSAAVAVSQVVSTILTSDLGLQPVAGLKNNTTVHYIDTGEPWFDYEPLKIRPTEFPRFAEVRGKSIDITQPPTTASPGPGRGVKSTGSTVRAFFPLPASTRSSLLYYKGLAGLAEAHVLCMSPTVLDLVFEDEGRITGRLDINFLQQVSGELKSANSFEWNALQSTISPLEMNCTVPITGYGGQFICPLKSPADLDCGGFPTRCLFESTNSWMLVINQTLAVTDDDLPDLALLGQLYNATGYGFDGTEWTTKLIYPSNGTEHLVGMTLCVAGTKNAFADVTAQAAEPFQEPDFTDVRVASFLNSSDSISFHRLYADAAASVRNQLDGPGDFQERGILNLTSYNASSRADLGPFSITVHDLDNRFLRQLPDFTPNNTYRYNESILPLDMDGFYTFLLDTTTYFRQPMANALQSIFSLATAADFAQLVVTDQLLAGAKEADVDISSITIRDSTSTVQTARTVTIPVQKRGMFIVCGIIGLHFITVLIIFYLYFTTRAPKFLDQAWHTLGQVLTLEEGGGILDVARTHGDSALSQLPEAAHMWESPVQITKEGYLTLKEKKPVDEVKTDNENGASQQSTDPARASNQAGSSETQGGEKNNSQVITLKD